MDSKEHLQRFFRFFKNNSYFLNVQYTYKLYYYICNSSSFFVVKNNSSKTLFLARPRVKEKTGENKIKFIE